MSAERLAVQKLDQYVKTAEAARFLGISQNTLRTWATEGKIPVRINPVNNYRLFCLEDRRQFLAEVERSFQQPRKPR